MPTSVYRRGLCRTTPVTARNRSWGLAQTSTWPSPSCSVSATRVSGSGSTVTRVPSRPSRGSSRSAGQAGLYARLPGEGVPPACDIPTVLRTTAVIPTWLATLSPRVPSARGGGRRRRRLRPRRRLCRRGAGRGGTYDRECGDQSRGSVHGGEMDGVVGPKPVLPGEISRARRSRPAGRPHAGAAPGCAAGGGATPGRVPRHPLGPVEASSTCCSGAGSRTGLPREPPWGPLKHESRVEDRVLDVVFPGNPPGPVEAAGRSTSPSRRSSLPREPPWTPLKLDRLRGRVDLHNVFPGNPPGPR